MPNARLDQSGTCPMQRKHCLLLLRLDRYKAHVRSLYRLADCFGNSCMSLVALDVRADKLLSNEAHSVSELSELATPVARRPARFHANRARLKLREIRQYVCTSQLPAYDDMVLRIYSMNLEQVLGLIQANSRYLHDERSFAVDITTSPLWHKPPAA